MCSDPKEDTNIKRKRYYFPDSLQNSSGNLRLPTKDFKQFACTREVAWKSSQGCNPKMQWKKRFLYRTYRSSYKRPTTWSFNICHFQLSRVLQSCQETKCWGPAFHSCEWQHEARHDPQKCWEQMGVFTAPCYQIYLFIGTETKGAKLLLQAETKSFVR